MVKNLWQGKLAEARAESQKWLQRRRLFCDAPFFFTGGAHGKNNG
jgi:hypothetical protein